MSQRVDIRNSVFKIKRNAKTIGRNNFILLHIALQRYHCDCNKGKNIPITI